MKSATKPATVCTKVIFIPKVPWYLRWLHWYSLETAIQPYVNKVVVWDGDGYVKFNKTPVSSRNGQSLRPPYTGEAFLLQLPVKYLNAAGRNKPDLGWLAN